MNIHKKNRLHPILAFYLGLMLICVTLTQNIIALEHGAEHPIVKVVINSTDSLVNKTEYSAHPSHCGICQFSRLWGHAYHRVNTYSINLEFKFCNINFDKSLLAFGYSIISHSRAPPA